MDFGIGLRKWLGAYAVVCIGATQWPGSTQLKWGQVDIKPRIGVATAANSAIT